VNQTHRKDHKTKLQLHGDEAFFLQPKYNRLSPEKKAVSATIKIQPLTKTKNHSPGNDLSHLKIKYGQRVD
jgi:hypothetical protein